MLGRAFPWEKFNFLIFLFSALCFYEIFLWFWIQNWEHCLRFWGFFFCFLSSSLHMLVTKMEIISIATLLKMKYLCLYSSLKWKCYSSRTLLCLDLGSAQCEEPGALKKNNSIKSSSPMLGFQIRRIWIRYLKHMSGPASYQSPPESQEGEDCIPCAFFRCPWATQVAADALCRFMHLDGHTALLGSEWQCTQTELFPSELDKGWTLSLFIICFLLLLWHGES